MATRRQFKTETIRKENDLLSPLKSLVETAFYRNNVKKVKTLEEAYTYASNTPTVTQLDQTVKHAEELGLPKDAKVLVENGSSVVGRTARARRIYGKDPEEDAKLLKIVMDAIYEATNYPFLEGEAIVGLDEEFMVRAHLLTPEAEANNLYSWLLNFQMFDEEYKKRYKHSKEYEENDIYIFSDPSWEHEDYPDGLSYIDSDHNVAVILGLQYFGELKKGTLTQGWGTAARQGYVACHGGLKKFVKDNDEAHVTAFFGLSGSGKSTLTHSKHEGKYDVTVLHDDAFIINQETGTSIALEPAYFDKTSDYPTGHPEQDYFVTVQNVGVTVNEKDEKVLVTEDIRNGNGRTIKSRYSTPNRVDAINEPINAIYWIMKDETLPPIIRVTDPTVASAMGCTLVTKRTSAENVENVGAVVVSPYANPFRVYPLVDDYKAFKQLFEKGVDCYVINTGKFMGKDIPPKVTLESIEHNVENDAEYRPFGKVEAFEYLPVEGYEVPFEDDEYREAVIKNMGTRIEHVKTTLAEEEAPNDLPDEIVDSIQAVVDQLGEQ
ncbi:MAG TPA: phosphoenolpyruvate carboxykinase (ATP) [Atopostipes sp.]|nr:phosphoenolpyruvate carboxykinase (ATP) [Atopostipes sp.]